MHRNCAVLDLAYMTAPLTLYSGRLGPFFDDARLVDQSHRVGTSVLGRDDLLHGVPHSEFIPRKQAEKLLQGARRHAGSQSDRFDALAIEVRELHLDIHRKMIPRPSIDKTVGKSLDKPLKLWQQPSQLLGIHAKSSRSKVAIESLDKNANVA
jgi:hypothetical protein